MRFTIFTPTYNRAHTITNLYESLKRQTFKDFEWVIVDDGSTDNTETLIKHFISYKNFFPIVYIKTKNGGKHRAFNIAVKEANGELFSCCDSDDYYLDNALEIIDRVEKSIPLREKHFFHGFQGLRIKPNGEWIGTTYNGDGYLDITLIDTEKNYISGDKAGADYTNIIRQFPFPEIEGENFLTEAVRGYKLAEAGYKTRFFNEPLKVCEYNDDGLTKKGDNLYVNNPKGWALYIVQLYKNRIITKNVMKDRCIYYCKKVKTLTFFEKAHHLNLSPLYLFYIINKNKLGSFLRKSSLWKNH